MQNLSSVRIMLEKRTEHCELTWEETSLEDTKK
jgi:hypothetical protein